MPDLIQARAALGDMARLLGVKAEGDREDYEAEIAALVLAALMASITEQEFVTRYTAAMRRHLTAAFARGAGMGELDVAATVDLDRALAQQEQHIIGLARDIYGGRYEPLPEDQQEGSQPAGGLALLAFLFGGAIAARMRTWGNAIIAVENAGVTNRRDDPPLTWRLGATEQHCRDCLTYDGQTRRASEWRSLALVGIQPQSPSLECGGWNCDCRLEPG